MNLEPVHQKLDTLLKLLRDQGKKLSHVSRLLGRVEPDHPESEKGDGDPHGNAHAHAVSLRRDGEDETEQERRPRKKGFWEWTIADLIQAVIMLTLIGTLWYTVQSYNVNRDALMSVQRAFITFDSMKINRVQVRDRERSLQFNAVWINSGTTPAIDTFQSFTAAPINHEPSEQEFQTIGTHPTFGSAAIGAKGTYVSNPLFAPEQDLLGAQFVKLPNGELKSAGGMAFWGWAVYRDVFKNTPVHLTEFCQQAESVTETTGEEPQLTVQYCQRHNCADNTCSDYNDIIKIVPPQ